MYLVGAALVALMAILLLVVQAFTEKKLVKSVLLWIAAVLLSTETVYALWFCSHHIACRVVL
jgi:hypothetical protein